MGGYLVSVVVLISWPHVLDYHTLIKRVGFNEDIVPLSGTFNILPPVFTTPVSLSCGNVR